MAAFLQAAAAQLRGELQAVEAQLHELQPPSPSHGSIGGKAYVHTKGQAAPGGKQSVGQAVAALAQQAQRGELPGALYGRLCNVARVAQPEALAAVNAVLLETCNPVGVDFETYRAVEIWRFPACLLHSGGPSPNLRRAAMLCGGNHAQNGGWPLLATQLQKLCAYI